MNTHRTSIEAMLASLPRVAPAMVGDSARVELSKAHDADLDFDLDLPLLPYQRAGVKFALTQPERRTYLGDEMGLGKTAQLIAVALRAKEEGKRSLIVVPPSLRENWRREVIKFTGGRLSVEVLKGTKPYALSGADVTIIGDATLKQWAPALSTEGFGFLGVDEAHHFKTPKAARTLALTGIASTIPVDGYVVLASGTPALNKPVELVSQFRILGVLDRLFGNEWRFKHKFCDPKRVHVGGGRMVTTFDGASNTDELHNLMRSTFYVRRRKTDVLTELPPKRRAQLVVELDKATLRDYNRIEAEFLDWVEDKGGREAVERASRAETITRLTAMLAEIGRAKLDAGFDHIESLVEAGEPVVIFAHHRDVIEAIMDRCAAKAASGATGWNAVKVYGGMTDETKQAAVDAFRSGEANIFVGNYDSAGVGLTLTSSGDKPCTQWVGMQLCWGPSLLSQAEDRIHRIGQTQSVTCWHLTAVKENGEETIDGRLYAVLNAKQSVLSSVLDGFAEDLGAEAGSVLAALLREWVA